MTIEKIRAEILAAQTKLTALYSLLTLQMRIDARESEQSDVEKLNRLTGLVCERRAVTRSQLISRARPAALAEARFIIWYLAERHLSLSITITGAAFDRHHTAVINGRQRMAYLMETEQELRREVAEVEMQFINSISASA